MIVRAWPETFRDIYGGRLPTTYVCIDTEFTGSSGEVDVILDIGHTLVEDCQVTESVNTVLDWTRRRDIDQAWLASKLNTLADRMGSGWRYTPAYLRRHGLDPVDVLRHYASLFQLWKKAGLFFVAQNGITVDERLLAANFNRFLSRKFELPPNAYFDTGAIYKATKIQQADAAAVSRKCRAIIYPLQTDSLKAYFTRITTYPAKGIRWNMPTILDEYSILKKNGRAEIELHGAQFDSLCVHWVMQEIRERSGELVAR